jgi:hypothetical protein
MIINCARNIKDDDQILFDIGNILFYFSQRNAESIWGTNSCKKLFANEFHNIFHCFVRRSSSVPKTITSSSPVAVELYYGTINHTPSQYRLSKIVQSLNIQAEIGQYVCVWGYVLNSNLPNRTFSHHFSIKEHTKGKTCRKIMLMLFMCSINN